VAEVGLYHKDGRRQWVELKADGSLSSASANAGGQRDLIPSQTVQLELMHGEKIEVMIDNFDRFLDSEEDAETLLNLAMEVSGATDAVRIRQAVGGGGEAGCDSAVMAAGRRAESRERQGREGRVLVYCSQASGGCAATRSDGVPEIVCWRGRDAITSTRIRWGPRRGKVSST
jgi:hypothetical protein